jgi:antitoxin component YwqK of YwqJK toxin-antitoxin module
LWYENGKKKLEGTYKDGKAISSKEWNKDGSIKE